MQNYPFLQKVIDNVQTFWYFVQNFCSAYLWPWLLQVSAFFTNIWLKFITPVRKVIAFFLNPVAHIIEWLLKFFNATLSGIKTAFANVLDLFNPMTSAITTLQTGNSVGKVATVFATFLAQFPTWAIALFIMCFGFFFITFIIKLILAVLP